MMTAPQSGNLFFVQWRYSLALSVPRLPKGIGIKVRPDEPYEYVWSRWDRRKRLWVFLVPFIAAAGVIWGAFLLSDHVTGAGRTKSRINALFTDIREGQFSSAYDRVCHDSIRADTRGEFISRLTRARDRGHGVRSFTFHAERSDDSLEWSTAVGTITFRDGKTTPMTLYVGGCIDSQANGFFPLTSF